MSSEPQATTEHEGVAADPAAPPVGGAGSAPAPAATPEAPDGPAAVEDPALAPDPALAGFGDTDGSPVGEPAEPEPVDDESRRYLALAQRTQADFDNFRKRATRDAALAADRGVSRVVKELLPALDHLELALQATERDAAAAEFAKGVRLVQDELDKALGRVGVEAFSPQGERFDPEQHEAMAQQPAEGAEAGTVILVYQQGYRLHGAVLRPARVVVAA